jgi:hypothetical protein
LNFCKPSPITGVKRDFSALPSRYGAIFTWRGVVGHRAPAMTAQDATHPALRSSSTSRLPMQKQRHCWGYA